MMGVLTDSVNAALLDAFAVAGQTFNWKGRSYGCINNAESAVLVTAKSLFGNATYPNVGDTIRLSGKNRQVTKLANSGMEFVAGGLVESAGPFVDDPENPSLAIAYDTFINK